MRDSQAVYTPGVSEHHSGTGSLFYANDALGSPRCLFSSPTTMTDDERFEAFGASVYHGGTSPTTTPYGWEAGKAHYQTDTSGLILMGHRFYDTTTGRFLSPDPIHDGNNWYAYCGNNPLGKSDPSGESGDDIDQAIDRSLTLTGTIAGGFGGGALGAGGGTLVAPGVGTIGGAVELGTLGAAGGAAVGHTIASGAILLRHLIMNMSAGGTESGPSGNKSQHALDRQSEGRPVRQALQDAQQAKQGNVFRQGDKYVVRGPNSREHILNSTLKKVVTSLKRSQQAHLNRLRQEEIKPVTEDDFSKFKKIYQH